MLSPVTLLSRIFHKNCPALLVRREKKHISHVLYYGKNTDVYTFIRFSFMMLIHVVFQGTHISIRGNTPLNVNSRTLYLRGHPLQM